MQVLTHIRRAAQSRNAFTAIAGARLTRRQRSRTNVFPARLVQTNQSVVTDRLVQAFLAGFCPRHAFAKLTIRADTRTPGFGRSAFIVRQAASPIRHEPDECRFTSGGIIAEYRKAVNRGAIALGGSHTLSSLDRIVFDSPFVEGILVVGDYGPFVEHLKLRNAVRLICRSAAGDLEKLVNLHGCAARKHIGAIHFRFFCAEILERQTIRAGTSRGIGIVGIIATTRSNQRHDETHAEQISNRSFHVSLLQECPNALTVRTYKRGDN